MTTDIHSITSHSDSALIDWLQNLQIDETSIERVRIDLVFEISKKNKNKSYYMLFILHIIFMNSLILLVFI